LTVTQLLYTDIDIRKLTCIQKAGFWLLETSLASKHQKIKKTNAIKLKIQLNSKLINHEMVLSAKSVRWVGKSLYWKKIVELVSF